MKKETEIKVGQVWVNKETNRLALVLEVGETKLTKGRMMGGLFVSGSVYIAHFRLYHRFVADNMSLEDFKEWNETGKNPTLKLETEIKSAENDPVHHPSHYTSHPSGIECIEITRHMSFNIGNAIKYLWRNGKKDGQPAIQDLQKAIWYIQDEIKRLEG